MFDSDDLDFSDPAIQKFLDEVTNAARVINDSDGHAIVMDKFGVPDMGALKFAIDMFTATVRNFGFEAMTPSRIIELSAKSFLIGVVYARRELADAKI